MNFLVYKMTEKEEGLLYNRLVTLVQEKTGYRKPITPETEIIWDIGIDGDEVDNLLYSIGQLSHIDFSDFYPQRHGIGNEPNIFGIFGLLTLPFILIWRKITKAPAPDLLPLRIRDLSHALNTGRLSSAEIEESVKGAIQQTR